MIHETPCAAFRAPLSRTGAQSLVKCRGAGQKVADATWSREVNKIAYRAVHTYPTHNSGIITSELVPSCQVTALPYVAHSTSEMAQQFEAETGNFCCQNAETAGRLLRPK